MSDNDRPSGDATFDAAVGQAKGVAPAEPSAQDGAQQGAKAASSHDRAPGKGQGRGGRRSGRRKARQVRDAKGRIVGNLPAPSSGPVKDGPAPAEDGDELPEPGKVAVDTWARVVKRLDGLISSGIGTVPLDPPEVQQGGHAIAVLMEYYAPKMGAAAGPWGPLYLFLVTAYGPRALELAERRFREILEQRRRRRLTPADAAEAARARETARAQATSEPVAAPDAPDTWQASDGSIRTARP